MGPQPTGIGVVARDLESALSHELVHSLVPAAVLGRTSRLNDIAIPGDLSPAAGRGGHWRRLCWTQQHIPQLIRETRASLLLSPLPEAPILQGVRSVVLAHDLLPLRYPQPGPLLAYHLIYVPLVLRQALRILCNSEATAREVHNRLRIPRERLIPIRLGFDQGNLRPLDQPKENFFLVLGRHDPHKNLGRVLKAFSLLSDQDCHLCFVGPHDSRFTPRLQKKAKELGIQNRCHWNRWVSDEEKLHLLNRCKALVIASLWEGFGLPALEAMACGAPVIAGSQGALPEVVGDVGYLVDPTNPFEICDAMNYALTQSAFGTTARIRGPQRALDFNWTDTARKIEQMMQNLA